MLSFSLSLLDMTCGCVAVLTDKVVCSRLQTQRPLTGPDWRSEDLSGPEGESRMDTWCVQQSVLEDSHFVAVVSQA